MLTQLSQTELIAAGADLRAQYLIQQAGYTLGIAHADGHALAALLPEHYLEHTEAARHDVDHARQDKTNAAAESKISTSTQNFQLREIKTWRKKIVSRCLRAKRLGASVPDVLTHMTAAKTVTDQLTDASEKVRLFEEHLQAIQSVTGKASSAALLDEGKKLYAALSDADAAQETKRFSDLPKAVREFFARKGELYLAIKSINDAGHELHVSEPELASRYNLKILHRRAPAHTAVPPAAKPAEPQAK